MGIDNGRDDSGEDGAEEVYSKYHQKLEEMALKAGGHDAVVDLQTMKDHHIFLREQVKAKTLAPIPASVNNEPLNILIIEGDEWVFDAPSLLQKLLTIFTHGQDTATVHIPGLTALVVGDFMNRDRGVYDLDAFWRNLLESLLVQALANKDITVSAEMEIIPDPRGPMDPASYQVTLTRSSDTEDTGDLPH